MKPETFLNAWWIAVTISHNKEMEYLNNPTPEVVCSVDEWNGRLKRLQRWASKRWGAELIGKMVYERQYTSSSQNARTICKNDFDLTDDIGTRMGL